MQWDSTSVPITNTHEEAALRRKQTFRTLINHVENVVCSVCVVYLNYEFKVNLPWQNSLPIVAFFILFIASLQYMRKAPSLNSR